jgi:hypothetical protein
MWRLTAPESRKSWRQVYTGERSLRGPGSGEPAAALHRALRAAFCPTSWGCKARSSKGRMASIAGLTFLPNGHVAGHVGGERP